MAEFSKLDPLIHAPVRLAVMTLLAQVVEADFTYLKETTGATDGNLSTHLAKLEEAGCIRVKKTFVGKKPRTTCAITESGRNTYSGYLAALRSYLETDGSEDA